MSLKKELVELENYCFKKFSRPPTKEEIEELKKNYWKSYRRQHNQDRKKRRIYVTFNPQQFKIIEQAAKDHKIKKTTFTRQAVMAYIENSKIIPIDLSKKTEKLTIEIRRIGGNVNQIAKKVNMSKQVGRQLDSEQLINNLKKNVVELERKVDEFFKG